MELALVGKWILARWRLILEGALLIVIVVLTIQTKYLKADNRELESKLEVVSQLGKAAKARAKEKEEDDAKRLKAAQDDAAAARAALAKWLSRNPPGGRIVPGNTATPAGTDRKGQQCYDTAELDGALQRFRDETKGLVVEGAQAVIDRQELVQGWPK